MFGMNNFFPEIPRPFNTQYRCYPVAMLPGSERSDVEGGGKIIMPPSALDQLTRLNIVYPMLFKLSNKRIEKTTHCGVLEFVAETSAATDIIATWGGGSWTRPGQSSMQVFVC